MSDFFTRLAERTLGLALLIQPIKPSLFAPEPGTGSETLLEIAEESEAAQAFSGTQTVEMPALSPDSGTIETSARNSETSATPSERAQIEQPRPPQPVRSNRHVPAMGPRSVNTAPVRGLTTIIQGIDATARQSGPRASIPAIPLAHREAQEPVSSSALIAQEHNRNAAKRSSMSDSNAGFDGGNISERYMEATTIRESSTLLHEQTIARHAILGERSTRGPLSRGVGSAPPALSLAAQARLEASAPEPAIQVTIGRVEVRAVTTPVPTTPLPTQSARPSAMSLDEYLRRQEQGGRR